MENDKEQITVGTDTSTSEETESLQPEKKPGLFSPERIKKTIGLIVGFIVLIVAAIIAFRSGTPEAKAEKFTKAMIEDDIHSMEKYMAYSVKNFEIKAYKESNDIKDESVAEELFYEKMSDEYNEDITSWGDYCKAAHQTSLEAGEDEFGKYTITVKATRKVDMSMKKLKSETKYAEESIGAIEKYADIDLDQFKKGERVTVKLKIKGENDTERAFVYVYLLKDGFQWKVLCYDVENWYI